MSEQEVMTRKEREASKTTIYRIPVRAIVGNTNPRNPLSEPLQKAGYTVFGDRSVWALAVSDDPEQRAEFVRLMQTYDEEFCAWAGTFLTQGQLQAVEVRDNGKKQDGTNSYTLVYGCRRALAILFNWCLTGKPKEPVVEAKLVKGANAALLQRAVVENVRRQPKPLEEARAIRIAINGGQTAEEVAQDCGWSVSWVQKRLALLDLPADVQKRIEGGTLTPTRALEQARAEKKGQADDPAPTRRVRPRRQLLEVLEEFAPHTPEYRAIAWVLGLRDKLQD